MINLCLKRFNLLLDCLGLMHKKSLGQVFLHDKNILRKIIDSASLSASHTVVEVGCGDGVLTEPLSQLCETVYVYEIDPICIEKTQARLGQLDHVQYLLGDVMSQSFESVQAPVFKVVANIPYYISAPFCQLLVKVRDRLDAVILMVQDAFARKLVAGPGDSDYSSLGLYLSYYFEMDILFKVPKRCFYPVPKVDSAVIRISPRESLPFSVDESVFFAIIRTGFWGRRKTLLKCLLSGPYLSFKQDIRSISFFKMNPSIRAESMGLPDFFLLYQQLLPYLHQVKDIKKNQ